MCSLVIAHDLACSAMFCHDRMKFLTPLLGLQQDLCLSLQPETLADSCTFDICLLSSLRPKRRRRVSEKRMHCAHQLQDLNLGHLGNFVWQNVDAKPGRYCT